MISSKTSNIFSYIIVIQCIHRHDIKVLANAPDFEQNVNPSSNGTHEHVGHRFDVYAHHSIDAFSFVKDDFHINLTQLDDDDIRK
jgi:hypothetical protein